MREHPLSIRWHGRTFQGDEITSDLLAAFSHHVDQANQNLRMRNDPQTALDKFNSAHGLEAFDGRGFYDNETMGRYYCLGAGIDYPFDDGDYGENESFDEDGWR